MWLPTKFYIHKENENLVEFREKKLKLLVCCVPAILVGLFCILLWSKHNLWQEILINGAGLASLYFGTIPLFSKGYLLIDKQNKKIFFKGGFRRFIFSYYNISFLEISHIEISNELKFRFGGHSYWDVITLILKNRNYIEFDFSNSEEYLNMLTYKISHFAGCEVYNNGA
jgi:hypothetical protein